MVGAPNIPLVSISYSTAPEETPIEMASPWAAAYLDLLYRRKKPEEMMAYCGPAIYKKETDFVMRSNHYDYLREQKFQQMAQNVEHETNGKMTDRLGSNSENSLRYCVSPPRVLDTLPTLGSPFRSGPNRTTNQGQVQGILERPILNAANQNIQSPSDICPEQVSVSSRFRINYAVDTSKQYPYNQLQTTDDPANRFDGPGVGRTGKSSQANHLVSCRIDPFESRGHYPFGNGWSSPIEASNTESTNRQQELSPMPNVPAYRASAHAGPKPKLTKLMADFQLQSSESSETPSSTFSEVEVNWDGVKNTQILHSNTDKGHQTPISEANDPIEFAEQSRSPTLSEIIGSDSSPEEDNMSDTDFQVRIPNTTCRARKARQVTVEIPGCRRSARLSGRRPVVG